MSTSVRSKTSQSSATPQRNKPPAVGFISLGCPKALTDSEQAISQLRAHGYRIAPSFDLADVVVINTCGFIESAQQESLDTIAEAIADHGQVIVTGCMGKNAHTIREAFPQVLAVTGPHDAEGVLAAVKEHWPYQPQPYESAIATLPEHGLKLTPPHYAYVKIAEGCDHACRFCIIPQLRGKLVSRPMSDIERECASLVAHGCQELLIIAQDTMAYGTDWTADQKKQYGAGKYPVLTLIDRLASLGVWLRLHYVYPYPFVDDLVAKMAEGKVLPYLDMPLQHSSQSVLTKMLRPAGPRRQSPSDHTQSLLQRINAWRTLVPNITLRSSFIVGFPGESEADFEHLLSFIAMAEFDRIGCFTYSAVEGAKANDLSDHVPESVKEERRARLMKLQEKISKSKLKQRVGKSLHVMVQDMQDHHLICRSAHEAPEIDGLVIVPYALEEQDMINVGDHLEILINKSDAHDVFGKMLRSLPHFSMTNSTIPLPKKHSNQTKKKINIQATH